MTHWQFTIVFFMITFPLALMRSVFAFKREESFEMIVASILVSFLGLSVAFGIRFAVLWTLHAH